MDNLSEEEEKAIKLLKEDKRMLEENYTFGKQAKLQIANDLEKALNLIEKQNKETRKLKNKNNELLRKLRNRIKEIKKLNKYRNYKTVLAGLNKTVKERNEIIDEMAKHIVSSAIVDDTICAIKCDCETEILEDCTYEKMLNCTKEYFRKKVEEK